MSNLRSIISGLRHFLSSFDTKMAFVGLFRSQYLTRSLCLPKTTQMRVLQPMSCLKLRSFTTTPTLARISPPPLSSQNLLPLTSTVSDFPFYRQFSTPVPKVEKRENIYTIPNVLTFSRILSTPIIAYLILHDKPYLATGLLLYAGMTDLIDGWIARRYNLKSVVGTVIDPMADKFLVITLTGALAYAGAMPGMHPPRVYDNGSLACGDYLVTGFWIGNRCFVLSIYFITCTKNVFSILGFLITLRRSSPDYYQQGNSLLVLLLT